jgi:hypothetical protein
MIQKLAKTNSFGGPTFQITLDVLFRININDDLRGNLIIDHYRRGIFRDKLLYSFTFSKDWSSLIPTMIERMRDYTNKNEKQGFNNGYWERTKEACLDSIPK